MIGENVCWARVISLSLEFAKLITVNVHERVYALIATW